MSTKRIGVDLDGVCYQWNKTARYMLRDILPNSPYPKAGALGLPSQTWNYIQENVSKEHWNWLWDEGVKLGLFRHGHMYPGTIKAIRDLASFAKVIVITSRPDTAVEDTLAWVTFHRLPISGIHILGPHVSKASVPQCDVYIDDKYENCVELAATGATVAQAGWEECVRNGPTPEGVVRVHSWDEFVKIAKEAPRVKR